MSNPATDGGDAVSEQRPQPRAARVMPPRDTLDLFDPPTSRHSDHDWRDYLRVLRRRIWPALAVFVIVVVSAAVHAYSRVPVYQARARLLVEVDLSELAGLRDPVAQDRLMNTQQMQITILQSRSLARRTLQAIGAWPADAAPLDQAALIPPPERPEEAALIDGFLSGLRVGDGSAPAGRGTQQSIGGLIDVSYISTDPAAAARNVNALIEQFIQQNLDRKSLASKQLNEWLTARLADQRIALDASERALQEYRERNGGASLSDQGSLAMSRFVELSEAYTRAKANRIAKETVVTQIETAQRNAVELESFPSLVGHPSLQQSQQEYTNAHRREQRLALSLGDRHPEMIDAKEATAAAAERLRQEIGRAIAAARADLAASRSEEEKLGHALEIEKNQSLTNNRTDVQLAVLQRDAQSNRDIYASLVQRINEYSVTQGQRSSNIRVLDAAEIPRSPLNTAAQQDLRYGVLGGLLLAVSLAFLLEHFDNAVKTPDQITNLGLPFLGMVPLLARNGDGSQPLIHQHTTPAFSEAIRGVRTNVRLSIPTEGMRSVAIASTNAGEGKTLMASNLAAALALAGERVMLIDADLRRPRLHDIFGVPQAPGLTNLLIGEAKASDLVHRTAVPQLHVLTCGTLPPNPSELLDSKRFREFLHQLGKYYDWVILDAPPIMPVTDAVVLADIADGVLLVAAAESTPLPLLRTAIDHLDRTTAIKLGVVLNKVNLEGRPYYYTKYYRADYKSYYVQPSARA